ncbi:hypothetical protein [Ralstonia pseudosolanacearum]|uniref:hypothetical protein n=1 Tax=Ralstonia pseudosolanacearum TaxID=1310165 RepID=UPI003CF6A944
MKRDLEIPLLAELALHTFLAKNPWNTTVTLLYLDRKMGFEARAERCHKPLVYRH